MLTRQGLPNVPVPRVGLLLVHDELGLVLALGLALGEALGDAVDVALADADGEALADADGEALAFGPQTWPHALARAMLAEQIYRAGTILAEVFAELVALAVGLAVAEEDGVALAEALALAEGLALAAGVGVVAAP